MDGKRQTIHTMENGCESQDKFPDHFTLRKWRYIVNLPYVTC